MEGDRNKECVEGWGQWVWKGMEAKDVEEDGG